MLTEHLTLEPGDSADEAAMAFERYDPGVGAGGRLAHRLLGRLTVASVLDFVRESSEAELLEQAGLKKKTSLRRSSTR